MSDKEERLLILTDTDPVGLCGKAHTFQYDFCPFTGNGKKPCREACGLGIPRAEAVERLAKGMRQKEWPKTQYIPDWDGLDKNTRGMYLELAEAALDALLK